MFHFVIILSIYWFSHKFRQMVKVRHF